MKLSTWIIILILVILLFYPVINSKIFAERLPRFNFINEIEKYSKKIKEGEVKWWQNEKKVIKREFAKEKVEMKNDLENNFSKLIKPTFSIEEFIKKIIKKVKSVVGKSKMPVLAVIR